MSSNIVSSNIIRSGAPVAEDQEAPKDTSGYTAGGADPDAPGPAPDEELEGLATNLPEGYYPPARTPEQEADLRHQG